jgi:PST family polysaccharide transporter
MTETALSLRERIFKGGVYLVIRQSLGVLIGFGNVLLLTYLIGPKNYGLYAAALGIIGFLGNMGRLGIDVYLIRHEREPTPEVYHQAFTVMFFLGMIVMLLGMGAIPFLKRWYQNPVFVAPYLALLLTLPLSALSGPALARFERDLNYRAFTTIDLAGQLVFCAVAFPLAYWGMGVWAPVIGYILWQFCLLIGACTMSSLIPRPYWSWPLLREMIGYGLGYSVSMWFWQLRLLVNPLIVGRYAGLETVGFVALSIRLADQLSFVKRAAWQLSMPALAKLHGDYQRLKRTMEDAMVLQVILLGPFLMGFALFGPWLLKLILGEQWRLVLVIYPFIALGILLNAVFSMHSSVLYVLKRNWSVTSFHLLHIFLFSASAFLLVRKFGGLGYGLAEVVALLGYVLIHFQVSKLFYPSYSKALPWVLAFIPPLFSTFELGYWIIFLWLPLFFILLLPESRRQVTRYFTFALGGMKG